MIMYYDFQISDCDSPQTLKRIRGKIPNSAETKLLSTFVLMQKETQSYYY